MSAPTEYPLDESVRRLIDDDDPKCGHAFAVLRQIGIMSGAHTIEDLFGVARKVAGLLISAGEVRS